MSLMMLRMCIRMRSRAELDHLWFLDFAGLELSISGF